MNFHFPSSRADALSTLREFLPKASNYTKARNAVIVGHPGVSRLSPVIRARLLLEREVAEAVLDAHPFSEVEKFVQEVYWRRYWKSWLELRPGVWNSYLEDLAKGWQKPINDRAEVVADGRGGIAVMDAFARELVETGYLHNHARMWFASYWVHIEKLPWQLGAQFFYRHLLDADAASNTLSWRWVAGLQTAGKTYRVRESNLRKYLDSDWLEAHSEGLERIGGGDDFPAIETAHEKPPAVVPDTVTEVGDLPERYAVVIHGSDLMVEDSPIAHLKPEVLVAVPDSELDDSAKKIAYRKATLADGVARAEAHFGCKAVSPAEAGVDCGVMLYAPVGSLCELPFPLKQISRQEDVEFLPLATSGFFKFWKGCRSKLLQEA